MRSRPSSKNTVKPIRASRPSSYPRASKRSAALAALLSVWVLAAAGCGPKYTYPAATAVESVETICMKEYGLKVSARVVGKTLGAVLYLDQLVDDKGQIPKEVHEQMGKVLQSVTRVALSTDLPVDFCTVSIRDRFQASELVITRSLDDTKRANADMIGIEESMNRTLFGQAHYPAEESQDENFVLTEVKIEKFLADQIVQRIRFNFSKDAKGESVPGPFALVDGVYEEVDGKRIFRFSVIGLKTTDDPYDSILNVFRVINQVLYGYHFDQFDRIEIQDYLNRLKLAMDRDNLVLFQQKKLDEKQILERFVSQSQSIQEAFRLFGFNIPQE